MNIVKIQYIPQLLAYLGGDADYLYDQYGNNDPDNEEEMKSIFRAEVLPFFERWDAASQKKAKDTLAYFIVKSLNDPTGDTRRKLIRELDGMMLIFGSPEDPGKFLIWLWDVIFPGEPYTVNDLTDYFEDPDIYLRDLKIKPES